MYLFERLSDRYRETICDRQTEIFPSLVHSPDDCNHWGRSSLNLGVCNSNLVSHMGVRGPSIWAIFLCLPRCLSKELGQKHSDVRYQCPSSSLTQCATVLHLKADFSCSEDQSGIFCKSFLGLEDVDNSVIEKLYTSSIDEVIVSETDHIMQKGMQTSSRFPKYS